jgi:hypothetical protein
VRAIGVRCGRLTHTRVAISLTAFYAAFWYLVIQYTAGRSTAHKIRLQIQCHSASMPMVALSSECWPSQKVKRSLIKEKYSSSSSARTPAAAIHGLPQGFRDEEGLPASRGLMMLDPVVQSQRASPGQMFHERARNLPTRVDLNFVLLI